MIFMAMQPGICNVSELKTFVGSKNYELSRDFYVALGFGLNWDEGNLAELQLGECKFFLQRYYQKQWCNNSMLHMTVADANAWYQHIINVLGEGKYGAARVNEPKEEGYGALVTHFWDPSGVLWHLAQPLDTETNPKTR